MRSKRHSWQLAAMVLVLGILLPAKWAWPQGSTGSGWITVNVPANARVVVNGNATRSTGMSRDLVSHGLTAGQAYRYQINVTSSFQGRQWSGEETVLLHVGETKRLTFHYEDSSARTAARPINDTSARLRPLRPINVRSPDNAPPRDARSTTPPAPKAFRGEEIPPIPLPNVPSAGVGSVFLAIPLQNLTLAGGSLPREYQQNDRQQNKRYELTPWATVAGAGEACVARTAMGKAILCVRTTPRDQITGQLFLPSAAAQKTVVLSYTATADQSLPNPGKTFFETKHEHYQRLFETCSAGRAWFRHQARSSDLRLRLYGSSGSTPTANSSEEHPLSDWFATMTGGRAVAENLKLNSYVSSAGGRPRIISVDSIRGINTRAMNWSSLLPKEQPGLDPLAACIPADQHAVFFPSVQQASVLAEHATGDETVFLRLADPRTEHWRIRERYEQQLGISLFELVELLGPDQPRRIALTGSDPYVVLGTDVAILIESSEADSLASKLAEHIASRVEVSSEIEVKTWNSPAINASGVCSADRRICSYVAALPQAVVLTNSVYQLQRLSEVHNSDQPSLASLPEYAFFRYRYALGEPSETALVVISDATIRRWGSPRWRIGQTRRLAAATALAEWQATWLRSNNDSSGVNFGKTLPEELTISNHGPYSQAYGSLEFMTPISALPLYRVSHSEKVAYERWRNAYESNWIRFDPIAMRFGLQNQRLEVDLTVMPLTMGTEYAKVRSLTQGVTLRSDAGDPHDSSVELAVAINTQSEFFKLARMIAMQNVGPTGTVSRIDPLKWFDGTISVYLDKDPDWEKAVRESERVNLAGTLTDQQQAVLLRVPLGIQLEATSGLELTKFLVALRSYVETSAAGMVKWELCEHHGAPYAKVHADELVKDRRREEESSPVPANQSVALYYAAYGDALIVSPNENVLRRAIDRRIARRAQADDVSTTADRGWLGENVALAVDGKALQLLAELVGEVEIQEFMQTRCWSNLAILNQWKRLYPDDDPVAVHERLWHVRTICPGGGDYVWNENWQTMESTVYGHPAAPKAGPRLPEVFRDLDRAAAGLTFENGGLRARFSLQMKTQDAAVEQVTAVGRQNEIAP